MKKRVIFTSMLVGIVMANVVYNMFDSTFNSKAAEAVQQDVQEDLPQHTIGDIPQD